MRLTKSEAVKVAAECARRYEKELNERSLLIICANSEMTVECLEFFFHSWNYQRLTGLKLRENERRGISSQQFYQRCLSGRLSINQIELSEDGTSELKLDVLPYLICKNLSAKMLGDFNHQAPRLVTEKLLGGQRACIGFVTDSSSGQFVPNTVLNLDIRDVIQNNRRVLAVFRNSLS